MNSFPPSRPAPCAAPQLNSWGWSRPGERGTENEDAFLNWPERRCWAVADGVGSSAHGGNASRLLVEKLMHIPEAASLDSHVRNARACLEEANTLLAAHALWPGTAASTIVALLAHGEQAACLWSGDSRCYLLRRDVLYQCTRDHTLRQEKIDKGELTVPEAYRMVRGNIITQAIGASAARIDEVRFTLCPGDRLLLCSDGLTGILDETTLAALLRQGTARACAERIRDSLSSCSQPDDVTLITLVWS